MRFTADDRRRLDEAAARALADLRAPGFSLGVVSGYELAHARGFGFADIESGRPQAPEVRQRIGSITKTMVGLCVMALADEGRLRLDDRLRGYIPEVVFHGDGSAVTLRHLLTHTAGIGEVAMPDEARDVDATLWSERPDHDVLGLFPRGVTLDAAPGSKWSYANLGFAMLGEVVARVEGAPVAEVLRRRIFAPLGMEDSDLYDYPHPDLATGYHHAPTEEARAFAARAGVVQPDEPTVDGANIRGRYLHIRGGGAAGAVQSNVPDMARYASALLRGGGGIVAPETFAAMIAPQWAPDPALESWGLSFQRFHRFGRAVFGHGGGVVGGWNSMLLIIPEEDLALIVHANASFLGFEKLVSRLLAATLAENAPAPSEARTTTDILTSAPGVYEALPGDLTNFRVIGAVGRIQIRSEGDHLVLHARRGPWRPGVRMRPDPAEPTLFRLDDDPLEPSHVRLVVDPTGRVAGLRCGRLVEMVRADGVAAWA